MFQKSAFDAPKKRIKNEDTEPTRKQLNHPFSIHLFTSTFPKVHREFWPNESDSSLELEGKNHHIFKVKEIRFETF